MIGHDTDGYVLTEVNSKRMIKDLMQRPDALETLARYQDTLDDNYIQFGITAITVQTQSNGTTPYALFLKDSETQPIISFDVQVRDTLETPRNLEISDLTNIQRFIIFKSEAPIAFVTEANVDQLSANFEEIIVAQGLRTESAGVRDRNIVLGKISTV